MTSAVIHSYFYFIVLPGTNGCVNSCVNSPEDGPVGLKHVEIQQYTNKIVTSVGFSFHMLKKMHGTKSLKSHSPFSNINTHLHISKPTATGRNCYMNLQHCIKAIRKKLSL